MYRAVEFTVAELRQTGKVLYFKATCIEEAVNNLLYSLRLSNGAAKIGPTGRCCYSGLYCYAVITAR